MLENKIKETIRDVVDFPKDGIVFKDITPILGDAQLTEEIADEFVRSAKELKPDAILGIESRGFFWGLLMAQKMGLPFIPVRKKGKLPYKTISYKYDLEYGSAEIEMHEDAVPSGMNVLIHDDLLATGGTAMAAAELVKAQGGNVVGFSFLVNLTFLAGDERLAPYTNNIISLVNY